MTVRWFVPPPESGTILAALHALMVAARAEPGSCGCQLTTDLGERAGLSYTEEWIHEDELKRQLRSDRFSRLAELMERATERPKVEFTLPSGMRGLEYAEAVRGPRFIVLRCHVVRSSGLGIPHRNPPTIDAWIGLSSAQYPLPLDKCRSPAFTRP
jgi:quinol monooxygenase YgiN